MNDTSKISQLLETLPQIGKVEWIGLRPARKQNMDVVETAVLDQYGLAGDRYAGNSGKRAVTLIQAEHLPAIAALLHLESVAPEFLRRNIVVSGINLLALKDKQFAIGDAVLEMTGLCHPCSRMEETFGAGGYNAVRGHGGITARVTKPGKIKTGDTVRALNHF
ncbi:MAG: MOSC domain-containing protein [Gammaproteobacteria bacterium]